MRDRHVHWGGTAGSNPHQHPRFACAIAVIAIAASLCGVESTNASERGNGKGEAWPGLFELNRMLTFYVVNDSGAAFDVSIRWNSTRQTVSDIPILVRVLGPDEQEVTRHLDPGLRTSNPPAWTQFEVPVSAGSPGIYQVIVTGSSYNVDFSVDPGLSWGVYGYPYLRGKHHLPEAYVYLPPNLSSLSASVQGPVTYLRLTDMNGVTHLNLTGANPVGQCALPPGEGQVWRLTSQGTNDSFGVTFGVAPIIMCPDEATALAIAASVDILEDGTVCFHKFQIAAHDLLEQYKQMDPSAFAVTPPPMAQQDSAWTANPTRNSLLLGPYGVYPVLPAALAEQNLNPASPWFGSIREWRTSSGVERPNPWTTYDRLNMTDPSPTINTLAAVYSIDDPINPLHHNVNLRNRIIIAALGQMMMIREHELPETTHLTYYGGTTAFTFGRMTRAYPWVIQQCPGNVQAVWTQGLRRYVDHMALQSVPQIANQWAFIMMGLQNFAKGTGEQRYRDYVQMHIDWLLQRRLLDYGAMPAGYFSDGEGPDASYAGMNMHFLAWLCEDAANQPLKQAMIKSFELFNHTIAPEQDGTWLGATSFNHRTADDWTRKQYTGGVSIMADDTADAAVLLGRSWLCTQPPNNANQMAAQQTTVHNLLTYYPNDIYNNSGIYAGILDGPMISMALFEHYMGTPVNGAQLPMKADNRFTRKFGTEFFAVRRPSYYTFLYSGKTFDEYRQPQRPSDPDVQYPRNGGGLSMLWSPKLGTSLLAQNWSAYSTNSIIATKGANTYFEDYWCSSPSLQTAQSRATINGQLTDDKMTFRRRFTFEEDRINCEIRLQRKQAIDYGRLWECFPYPLDKPDPITVTLYDAQGRKINGNNKVASAIVFSTSVNEVHIIAFNEPRRCEFGTQTSVDLTSKPHEFGRVLTRLPEEWNANQVRTVSWTARIVRPNQIKTTIKQMVGALQ